MIEHAFDEAYFVGGTKSNYEDYRELEPAIDRGFMPVVRQYADYCAAGKAPRAYLDVGCAMGFYVERLASLGWQAFGVDISEYAVEQGRLRGVEGLLVGRADDLPYADDSFDFVTSIDVIEHVDAGSAAAMVEEIRRVLRPGGLSFVATPNFVSNQYWNRYTPGFVDRDATHVNYLSAHSLRALFAHFRECEIYGHTPFVEQFHAFELSRGFESRLFRLPAVDRLARHVAWKLLGRSIEYSSYLHAVAIK